MAVATLALLSSLLVLLLLALLAGLGFVGAHYILYDPTRIAHSVWPEHFGLAYEKVQFATSDGLNLKGWVVPAGKPSGRSVLLCHGWGANKGHILEQTKFLRERGFDLFYFDFRGCGESEGRLGTIGYLEARDFDAALEHIRRHRPRMLERLGVYGQSMGGAVALAGATRHEFIKAAVIESAYLSYNKVVSTYAKAKWGLPRLPLIPAILWATRLTLGADPEPASPAYCLHSLDHTPVLYVWGSEDRVMPVEWGRELFERTPGTKEMFVVAGARHAKLWEATPAEYEERIGRFFENHV